MTITTQQIDSFDAVLAKMCRMYSKDKELQLLPIIEYFTEQQHYFLTRPDSAYGNIDEPYNKNGITRYPKEKCWKGMVNEAAAVILLISWGYNITLMAHDRSDQMSNIDIFAARDGVDYKVQVKSHQDAMIPDSAKRLVSNYRDWFKDGNKSDLFVTARVYDNCKYIKGSIFEGFIIEERTKKMPKIYDYYEDFEADVTKIKL